MEDSPAGGCGDTEALSCHQPKSANPDKSRRILAWLPLPIPDSQPNFPIPTFPGNCTCPAPGWDQVLPWIHGERSTKEDKNPIPSLSWFSLLECLDRDWEVSGCPGMEMKNLEQDGTQAELQRSLMEWDEPSNDPGDSRITWKIRSASQQHSQVFPTLFSSSLALIPEVFPLENGTQD